MPRLKKNQKIKIVKHLACMKSPSEVVEAVKQEFGIEIPRSQVCLYNPDLISGTNLSKELRHLYYDTRRKYVEEESEVPVFHKGYRMNEIQDLYEKAKRAGNIVLAMQLLEQAAKESGGFYEKGVIPDKKEDGLNFFQQLNQTIINQRSAKKDE